MVLTNWILRRRGVDVPINSFKFEKHFVLHPNRQVKVNKFKNYKNKTSKNDLMYKISNLNSNLKDICQRQRQK